MRGILNGESRIVMIVFVGLFGLTCIALFKWNAEAGLILISTAASCATLAIREHYALKRFEMERGLKPQPEPPKS